LHNGDEIKFGDIICSFEEHKTVESNKNVSEQFSFFFLLSSIKFDKLIKDTIRTNS